MARCGLETRLPNSKVSFHLYDLDKRDIGLVTEVATSLAETVTHYIHCAWPVDWNRRFSSFRPALQGVCNLLQFVSTASKNPKLFFVSSVATAGNWGTVPGARLKVPEEEIDDWKVARFGYGQAKLVAERLIADASRTHGLTAVICRVGQVAGPVRRGNLGMWPEQEWFPSLIRSSSLLRCVPETLGPLEDVDWVPVDYLSQIMVELLLCDQPAGSTTYYHIVNPEPRPWQSLLPSVQAILGPGTSAVSLPAWVDALESSAASSNAEQNPAVKLLPFFSDLRDKALHLPRVRAAMLDVKHTSKRSITLREMNAIHSDWMALWMRQWGYGQSGPIAPNASTLGR